MRKLIVFVFVACGAVVFIDATAFNYTSSVYVSSAQEDLSTLGASTADGFAWFSYGFKLGNGDSLTISVVPPVCGEIDLNSGGVLTLGQDLVLGSNATIINSGTIAGGGKVLSLTGDLSYSGVTKTLTISDDLVVDGQSHKVTLGGSSTIAIASGVTLTLKNMTLDLATTATAFSFADGTSELILQDVRVVLSENVTCAAGKLTIAGKTVLTGVAGNILTYSSSGNCTIQTNSELLLDHNITFKHNYASADNFVFTDRTSRLVLVGGTFESAARALALTLGTVFTDHYSYMKGTGVGSIVLGHGTNRLYIVFMPAASLDTAGNAVTYANAS